MSLKESDAIFARLWKGINEQAASSAANFVRYNRDALNERQVSELTEEVANKTLRLCMLAVKEARDYDLEKAAMATTVENFKVLSNSMIERTVALASLVMGEKGPSMVPMMRETAKQMVSKQTAGMITAGADAPARDVYPVVALYLVCYGLLASLIEPTGETDAPL